MGCGSPTSGAAPSPAELAAGVPQQLDDLPLGFLHGPTRQLLVGGVRGCAVEAREGRRAELHGEKPPIASDDLAKRKALLPPPRDIRGIAEGAHHQDAGPLFGVHELAAKDRHRRSEERRDGLLAKQRPISSVRGMRGHTDARGQQLGPRRSDDESSSPVHAKAQLMVRAAQRPVLRLGLGHGRSEVHVPHGGSFDVVDVSFPEQVEEARLGDSAAPLVDGRVLEGPIHRQAEALPERLEGLLVLGGEGQAELDEVGPRHPPRRRLRAVAAMSDDEALFIGHRGLAAHVEMVLDAALGGQTVVVPPHRIEDVSPRHPPVSGEDVGLGVAEHVADVERARDRRGRRVDEEFRGRCVLPEGVGGRFLPGPRPALLRFLRLEMLWVQVSVLQEMGSPAESTRRGHPFSGAPRRGPHRAAQVF